MSNNGGGPVVPVPPPPPPPSPGNGDGSSTISTTISSTISSTITYVFSSTTAAASVSTTSSAPNLGATQLPTAVPTTAVPAGQCPMPKNIPDSMMQRLPISGQFTFHDISIITAGACMAFTVMCMAYLMWKHLRNIKRSQEQLHILRICAFIPLYAIGTFITVAEPNAFVWLECWLKVLEGLALAWFYLLMHWLLVPEETKSKATEKIDLKKDVFLLSLILPAMKNHRPIMQKFGSYRRQWTFVFQCPIVLTICAIATNITHSMNKYCLVSTSTEFAHLPISIVQMVSIIIAVVAVIKAYMPLKAELQPHRTMSKLMAFKLLIGLQILQSIIYQILTSLEPSPLEPTAYLSPVDIGIGIPMMIVNIEMVFFSVFYYYAYTVGPYKLQPDEPPATGPLRAFFQIINQGELMSGMFFVFTISKHARAAAERIGDAHVREPEPKKSSRWKFWQKNSGGSAGSSHQEEDVSPLTESAASGGRKPSSSSAWSVPIGLQGGTELQPTSSKQNRQSRIGMAR